MVEAGTAVRLPDHAVRSLPHPGRPWPGRLQERLRATLLAPPPCRSYAPSWAPSWTTSCWAPWWGLGQVVRVGDELLFDSGTYREMVQTIVNHLRAPGGAHGGAGRDLFGTSRRYVLPLLEQLDRERVTRRRGDERFSALRLRPWHPHPPQPPLP